MKHGTVLLIGRPNVGKSTFLNTIVGMKVAITSPKPQTTRIPVRAIYKDDRGELIFTDTPGIFGKTVDTLSKKINIQTLQAVEEQVDMVVYMVDHTRKRDFEESRVLGIARKVNIPHKILVINKMDLTEKTFMPQYEFLKDEFDDVFEISALKQQHIKPLMEKLFAYAPEKDDNTPSEDGQQATPLLNMDSKLFVGELIREKVFLMVGEELPYTTTAVVDEIAERENSTMYIRARILTTSNRYKGMLIGKEGRKIKEIGSYARKEIALATGKKVYLDLTIEVDPHWQEVLYG